MLRIFDCHFHHLELDDRAQHSLIDIVKTIFTSAEDVDYDISSNLLASNWPQIYCSLTTDRGKSLVFASVFMYITGVA